MSMLIKLQRLLYYVVLFKVNAECRDVHITVAKVSVDLTRKQKNTTIFLVTFIRINTEHLDLDGAKDFQPIIRFVGFSISINLITGICS